MVSETPVRRIHWLQYERAEYNFANLDILVGNVMTYQALGVIDVATILPKYNRVNIFYSNPEYYTDCKYEEVKHQSPGINGSGSSTSVAWSVKKDDFFPYADGPHNFWTGYFTSRTAFKRFERVASGFLMAARQVYALVVSDGTDTAIDEEPLTSIESSPLYALEDALGVSQHHDSVSGTAKQHVADDYSLRVQKGLDRAAKYVVQKIRKVMLESSDLTDLTYCPLLNESICEVSEVSWLV
jgi:Alpha mannosidase middle domain